ncbi:MAG: amidohydrolase [Ferruginibacter sp.]|nr:amidohydrolase [Bacteroidota bacterium]MBX2918329.1 amidohydrolase [Ferruginibacter sp.]MCB0709038.1 amidohydrolase [Chitinophagaceae bacterium]MCC7378260.1 amidohydrolase [Chitinophagaceae bacterium]
MIKKIPVTFLLTIACLVCTLASCKFRQKVALIVHHAKIYTVDEKFSVAEAMAVNEGKIIAIGKNDDILKQYESDSLVDAGGKTILPGFNDVHAHFVGYAYSLKEVNLVDTKSWDEVLARCSEFEKKLPAGTWLTGRGWDQNDWEVKQFPDNTKLNELFPNRPVILERIDGHAAIANTKALELAGIKPGDKLTGGEIETKNGNLTGILVDNAEVLVYSKIPAAGKEENKDALLQAQQNCFAVGLTSVNDCGLDYKTLEFLESLQKDGVLKMRMNIMLSDAKENYDYAFKRGKIKTDYLNVSSFKVYADGALGSRGACLLQPYSDKPGWTGFLLSPPAHFDSVAALIAQHGWQMCTHAIGDSGNRTILNTYAKYLKGKNDLRWRIEHAQVINENDFHLFGDNNIVPSVQPTHATSDMYWAADRLGPVRVKGAYAFKQLLDENGWIPLGTDFPVEDISPFKTFFAAVVRQDAKGFPPEGFQIENALTREQAIRGMTIWAAKASFDEKRKGSLETGKLADFIILDTDLITCEPSAILNTKVIATYSSGKKVYGK